MKKLISNFTKNPKGLFLLDSFGACYTAFFLFVIMRTFNEYFGMPLEILNYLTAIAVVFFLYSGACFLFLKRSWTFFLRIIAFGNLSYCLLTAILVIQHNRELTMFGLAYFILEIGLIVGISYIELKVAARKMMS